MDESVSFQIRPAETDDVETLLAIRTAVRENFVSLDGLTALGITADSLRRMLEDDCGGWCAESSDRTIGFAMNNRIEGSVFALFVDPRFEGIGAGRALLQKAISDLRDHGHLKATLSTEEGTRAERFYRAQGWIDRGRTEHGEIKFKLDISSQRS